MTTEKMPPMKEIHDELLISNRLMIVSLVRSGIQQKDVAAAVGVSDSVLSRMFSKGLLKRIAESR